MSALPISTLRAVLPRRVRAATLPMIRRRSIDAAVREQRLGDLREKLSKIAPDISDQYTAATVDTPSLITAVRSLHAFQVKLASEAIRLAVTDGDGPLTVVDIGDSAGTHLRYLHALFPELELRTIGINVDPAAVKRIRGHGIEALETDIEKLREHSVDADVFLSFETFEHLPNPIEALRHLSYETSCRAFALTVPYVRHSRVALFHIRAGNRLAAGPENTHLFEFSPGDWKLLFLHAGWEIISEQTYLQYPRRNLWRLTQPLWARTESMGTHEGFWGVVLRPNHTWSSLYTGW